MGTLQQKHRYQVPEKVPVCEYYQHWSWINVQVLFYDIDPGNHDGLNLEFQSIINGLGQLFSDRKFQPVFWICQRLGGEKDQVSFDEVKKTPWLRLGQME